MRVSHCDKPLHLLADYVGYARFFVGGFLFSFFFLLFSWASAPFLHDNSRGLRALRSVCLSIPPPSCAYFDIQGTGREVCPLFKFPLLMQPPTGERRISATVFFFSFFFFLLFFTRRNSHCKEFLALYPSAFHHALGMYNTLMCLMCFFVATVPNMSNKEGQQSRFY